MRGAKDLRGINGPHSAAVYSAHAMQRCKLTAHVSTKLNRSHLITGERALILPCLGRTEEDIQATGKQFLTVEDSMALSILRKASCGLLRLT
jgi:hypothetical protein